MLKKSLIIISIIFNVLTLRSADTLDSLLAFADKEYFSGHYKSAVKEYLRIGFFRDFSDPEIQLRLANSYYRMGDWEPPDYTMIRYPALLIRIAYLFNPN
jgi:hypothetical protein